MREAIESHGGTVFQIIGDAFAAAFHTAPDALNAAVDAQRALQREPWSPAAIKVRMGISTGMAQARELDPVAGGYSGYSTLARAQRVMSSAYAGQILVSNASAELLRGELPSGDLAAGITLRDMGEHRLKGILNLERLWQVLAPDLPQEFPALATLNAIPNNLPVQTSAFVGREQELAAINALLADSHNRLVTIVAPGGMGKTRLAVEVASRIFPAFPQGVYFVALDRVSSADLIVQTVAEVLPISLSSKEDPLSRITDYLRDKAVLMVMDNYEHVLDGVGFVQEILRAAPRVQILATSRAKLNLMSETAFNIGGLTIDASSPEKNERDTALRRAGQADAARL